MTQWKEERYQLDYLTILHSIGEVSPLYSTIVTLKATFTGTSDDQLTSTWHAYIPAHILINVSYPSG